MEIIPVIASADDLDKAIELAKEKPGIRYFVEKACRRFGQELPEWPVLASANFPHVSATSDEKVYSDALVAALKAKYGVGYLEISDDLFADAFEQGLIVQSGVRESDGAVMYDLNPVTAAVDTLKHIMETGSDQEKFDAAQYILEKYGVTAAVFSGDQREKLADSGKALPDGSFPIRNKSDLANAIRAFGRAKDKDRARRWIIKRAKELGAISILPESWGLTASAAEDELPLDLDRPAVSDDQLGFEIINIAELLGGYARGELDAVTAAGSVLPEEEEVAVSGVDSLMDAGWITDTERDDFVEALTAAMRHVRTPEGARRYGQPIGALIVKDTYLPRGSKTWDKLAKGDIFSESGKTWQVEDISIGTFNDGNGTKFGRIKAFDRDDPDTSKEFKAQGFDHFSLVTVAPQPGAKATMTVRHPAPSHTVQTGLGQLPSGKTTVTQTATDIIVNEPSKQDKAFAKARQKRLDEVRARAAARRTAKSVGPSNEEKIKNAETMYGTNSPQHILAKRKFGAPGKTTHEKIVSGELVTAPDGDFSRATITRAAGGVMTIDGKIETRDGKKFMITKDNPIGFDLSDPRYTDVKISVLSKSESDAAKAEFNDRMKSLQKEGDDSPGASLSFTSGKTKSLGTVNPAAKGNDPERFTPKETLADGTTPKVGDKVIDSSGRTGTIVQTYQLFTGVKWDDGKSKTVKNSELNKKVRLEGLAK